jgi:hypothetical protein
LKLFLPFYAPLRRMFPRYMDCEQQICPDLVGATVIEHRVPEYLKVKNCYRIMNGILQVDGCMELNLTTKVCHIYMDKKPTRLTVNHEWSHCMGWAHTWDNQRQRYEWFPMPELSESREPPVDSLHMSDALQGFGARQSYPDGR